MCNSKHNGMYGSGRFCSSFCARKYSTHKKLQEINYKKHLIVMDKIQNGQFISPLSDKNIHHKTVITKHKNMKIIPFDQMGDTLRRKIVMEDQNGKCNRCGLNKWLNQDLVLELEHKDGNRNNNSRENLEFICPNCHSLTKTWRGRNKSKNKKLTDDDYLNALKNSNCIHSALKKLNVAQSSTNYKRAKKILLNLYNNGIILDNYKKIIN